MLWLLYVNTESEAWKKNQNIFRQNEVRSAVLCYIVNKYSRSFMTLRILVTPKQKFHFILCTSLINLPFPFILEKVMKFYGFLVFTTKAAKAQQSKDENWWFCQEKRKASPVFEWMRNWTSMVENARYARGAALTRRGSRPRTAWKVVIKIFQSVEDNATKKVHQGQFGLGISH